MLESQLTEIHGMSIPLEEVLFCIFLFPPGVVVLTASSHQQ